MLINFSQEAGKLAPHRVKRAAFLADLVEPWCDARRADGYRKSGIARYRNQVLSFARWAGDDATVMQLTEPRIRAYKVDLGGRVAPGTTRNAITSLRAFCDFLILEGHLTSNPALLVTHPIVVDPPPNPLSRSEIDALLEAIDAPPQSHQATWRRNRRAVLLMIYAGLRRTETAKLLRCDIDLARREIIVKWSKGGKSRVIPVCDELAEELEYVRDDPGTHAVVGQADGRPLAHNSIGHIFERWLPGRGIVVTPHQLRRTFATELYRRGEDLFTIQRLLGHSDPKTTLRYIGASSEKEHAAVNKLTFRAARER